MQCFICVTYMIILCGASPPGSREIATTHEKRSLFRDVIESLRIRAQLPEDTNQSEDNNLAQNYDGYGYDSEQSHLPSDDDYLPRRNDRIEMPSLNYRFPKSIDANESDRIVKPKPEVVIYIDDRTKTTQKPKKEKRPKPIVIHKSPNKNKDNEQVNEENDTESQTDNNNIPFVNNMAGQSQIGNRESQTVVKPTVIVNFRGSVNHKDSDIRLNRKQDNKTVFDRPQNVFNINQEINIEKEGNIRSSPKIKQEVKLLAENDSKFEEDMMMCETATWKPKNNQDNRKFDNVLEILFNI